MQPPPNNRTFAADPDPWIFGNTLGSYEHAAREQRELAQPVRPTFVAGGALGPPCD
jgi:hypothetical protein